MVLVRKRAFRWPVWTALVCGVLPLAVFWRFLMAIKETYGPHIFAGPFFGGSGYYAIVFSVE